MTVKLSETHPELNHSYSAYSSRAFLLSWVAIRVCAYMHVSVHTCIPHIYACECAYMHSSQPPLTSQTTSPHRKIWTTFGKMEKPT